MGAQIYNLVNKLVAENVFTAYVFCYLISLIITITYKALHLKCRHYRPIYPSKPFLGIILIAVAISRVSVNDLAVNRYH